MSSLPPSALRADTSLSEGGKGDGFPRQCEHWLGMTALRAVRADRVARPYAPCHCEERSDAAIRFPFRKDGFPRQWHGHWLGMTALRAVRADRVVRPYETEQAQNGTVKTPSPTKMTTLSGGHFLRFYAPVSEPARPRWGCWRPETHRCRCAWWWRRPC